MIYTKTRVIVADNTGAKTAECIRTSNMNSTYAKVGDIITVSIKSVTSTSKIKKGSVQKALIVRTKSNILRRTGRVVSFDDNAVVLIKADKTVIGTRISGPIASEVRSKITNVVSMAKEVI